MIELPDFKVDNSKVPIIRLKSISLKNYKVFDNYCFDFTTEKGCKLFACFIGPNGCGKTTLLEIIQLIFSRFEGYDEDRLKYFLGKSVRDINGNQEGVYGNADFLITAQIESSLGDYEIQINKNGFIKDHPDEIKFIVYRLCYFARFDQELYQFQLARKQWGIFSELFEAVTGFKAEEREGVFDESADPIQAKLLNDYVLGFWVHKPHEVINYTECSSGERKIIKSFSTLLNKEYNPQIILIDNIAMHVESGRHLNLIKSMKKCFPNSQIFGTTHSYQISRNFGEKNEIYDLRFIRASKNIIEEPWRLYLADEVKDCLSKLKAMTFNKEEVGEEIDFGEKLLTQLSEGKMNIDNLKDNTKNFFNRTSYLFIQDVVGYYSNKKNLISIQAKI